MTKVSLPISGYTSIEGRAATGPSSRAAGQEETGDGRGPRGSIVADPLASAAAGGGMPSTRTAGQRRAARCVKSPGLRNVRAEEAAASAPGQAGCVWAIAERHWDSAWRKVTVSSLLAASERTLASLEKMRVARGRMLWAAAWLNSARKSAMRKTFREPKLLISARITLLSVCTVTATVVSSWFARWEWPHNHTAQTSAKSSLYATSAHWGVSGRGQSLVAARRTAGGSSVATAFGTGARESPTCGMLKERPERKPPKPTSLASVEKKPG